MNISKKEIIKKEVNELKNKGIELLGTFTEKKNDAKFSFNYQIWYTNALKVIEILARDRYNEFVGYYEIDQKRKALGYGTYVIQDYLKGVAPSKSIYSNFDTRGQVKICFTNQLSILGALESRIDSVLSNIEEEIYIEIQDAELSTAKELLKSSPRAAGALTGVIIETYLQKVVKNRGVTISKKHPTISDMNDPLKTANIIDTPSWRKITYLADLRNLCSHKKDVEPTKEQVIELIEGANWLLKNIF